LQDTLAAVRVARGIQTPRVALWGVTFKGGTNDVRDSPALDLLRALERQQIQLHVHDPGVDQAARTGVATAGNSRWFEDKYAALEGVDALLIATAWNEYRQADLERIAVMLGGAPVIDGRNLFEPGAAARAGLDYVSLGRPSLSVRRGG